MTGEEIVGIIPNTHAGFLGQKAYNLIVTNHRLIAAEITKDMINDAVKKTIDESKEQEDGFFKRTAKTMTSGLNLYRKYYEMPIQNIINENPGNYSISVDDVKKIRINIGMMYENDRQNPNEIRIKWNTGKETFRFSNISSSDVKNILKKTFGNRVK
jgi:hypothetical protein